MIVLRPYQEDLVGRTRDALRSVPNVLVQAPTGSGKTYLVAYMFRQAVAKGLHCWFVVHRKELLDQAAETMQTFGIPYSYIAAGRTYNRHCNMQLCTVQTLARRLQQGLRPPDFMAFDEAHHAVAATWMKVIQAYPDAWNVGLTATPERSDGRGLKPPYAALVTGPSPRSLIDNGHLADFDIIQPGALLDMKGVPKRGGDYAKGKAEERARVIVGDCVDHYQQFAAPHTCLVYCVTRNSARDVRDRFRARDIDARYVAGDTPKQERADVMHQFRTGDIPVVVSVDLFGEGLDAPGLKSVMFLRPTMSLPLYLQQCGRALRPDSGRAVIIDPVGNVFRHGLPDQEREWTLEDGHVAKPREADDEPDIMLSRCDVCFAVFKQAPTCPRCGYQIPVKKKPPKEVKGELKKLTEDELEVMRKRIARRKAVGRARNLRALTKLAMQRGYKVGWAARQMGFRAKHIPYFKLLSSEKRHRRELRDAGEV